MKKGRYVLVGALVVLLAGGLFAIKSQVRAEDTPGTDQQPVPTLYSSGSNSNDQQNISSEEDEIKKEDSEIDEVENDEDSVKSLIDQYYFDPSSELVEVDSDKLATYGDAVAVLDNYSSALDRLTAEASVTSTFEASLSPAELTLLSGVLTKYKIPFVKLNTRIQEIKDQMKAVNDLLTPLASMEISPLLKKSIVSALKDFREEIKSLSELEHLNYDIIDTEISN
jgi:hypothetical protein